MAIKINSKGRTFANSLISAGKIDATSSWSFTATDGNKLLDPDGEDWTKYGKHHLAINDGAEPETKTYYQYPFAKNDKIYRRRIVEIKNQATQQSQDDIAIVVDKLLQAIDDKLDRCPFKRRKKKKKDAEYQHVAIIRERDEFKGGTFEWNNESLGIDPPMGVWVNTGILKDTEDTREMQSVEFSISQFTEKQAKEYLDENGIEYKRFKKATKKVDSSCRIDIIDFVPVPNDEEGKRLIEDRLYQAMKRSPEGYLIGRAVVTNVGVFPYKLDNGKVRWELRPPEEVFHPDSLNSLKMKPITDSHPKEAVTSENIKKYGVGSLGENIATDAYRVSIPITINRADAVESVNDGKEALSCGYTTDIEEKEGTWMGVPYQAIQRNIRYNHTALVDRARAGDAAKLKVDAATRMDSADSDIKSFGYQINQQTEVKPMLKKIKLDNGIEYEAEEKVIDALHVAKTSLDEANKKLGEVDTLKKEKSELQAKHDTLEDENKKLKEGIEKVKKDDPKRIDEAVKARMELLDAAKKAEVEVKENMSEQDIKKEVILKAFPNAKEKLDKADEAYVDARFDSAIEHFDSTNKVDEDNNSKLTDDLSQTPEGEKSADEHRDEMVKDLENDWKDKE